MPWKKTTTMEQKIEFVCEWRTGRILLLLYLKMGKSLDIPAIYLSEYITKNKINYFKKLRNITESNDWEGYIFFICLTSANKGLIRLESITSLMDTTAENIYIINRKSNTIQILYKYGLSSYLYRTCTVPVPYLYRTCVK